MHLFGHIVVKGQYKVWCVCQHFVQTMIWSKCHWATGPTHSLLLLKEVVVAKQYLRYLFSCFVRYQHLVTVYFSFIWISKYMMIDDDQHRNKIPIKQRCYLVGRLTTLTATSCRTALTSLPPRVKETSPEKSFLFSGFVNRHIMGSR